MRVLIVHDFGIASGGAENMSLALRKGLDIRGHEARIFASRARPADAQPVVVVHDRVQVFAQRPDFLVHRAAPEDGRLVHLVRRPVGSSRRRPL
jgi:hypothetical protein